MSCTSRVLPTAAIAVAALVSGCVSHVHTPYEPSRKTPARDVVSSPPVGSFDYTKGSAGTARRTPVEAETSTHHVWRIAMPSYGDSGQPDNLVAALYYQSKSPGPKALVVVLPIWGSHTYPPEKITRMLVRRGGGDINVLRILGENRLIDWPTLQRVASPDEFVDAVTQFGGRFRTATIDVRRMLDWAESQPETDPQRIGMVGFSISAVVGALVVTNDPRLAASVLVMGGARPAQIVATCPGRMGTAREAILERFEWSVSQYEAVVAEVFRELDPAHYAGRVDPHGVLMIDAHHDDCMPQSARDSLWRALGRPERISFRYKHKMAFLSMTPLGFNFLRQRIYRFLDERLRQPKSHKSLHYVLGWRFPRRHGDISSSSVSTLRVERSQEATERASSTVRAGPSLR